MQQEAIWLDHTWLAGQCIDLYFCSGCCTSVVSLWTTSASLTGSSGRASASRANDGVESERGLRPCPPLLPTALTDKDLGGVVGGGGLCYVYGTYCSLKDATQTLVGEQRRAPRYLSLDSWIYIIRIWNQTVRTPTLFSNCQIFLSLSFSLFVSHSLLLTCLLFDFLLLLWICAFFVILSSNNTTVHWRSKKK